MKYWTLVLVVACLPLLDGCGGTKGAPEAMPADFSLAYHWSEGSVPPPYHYEYTITLQPDGAGLIEFWPDYPGGANPQWSKAFSVSAEDRARLYAALRGAGVWSETWRRQDPPPVGGSTVSLKASAGGFAATIPADLVDAQAAGLKPVYAAIEQTVPQDIWDGLRADRQRYEDSYQK